MKKGLRFRDQSKALREAVRNPRLPLLYSRRFRIYRVHVLNPTLKPPRRGFYIRGTGEPMDRICYDPFTGKPLPGALKDEWYEATRREFGILYVSDLTTAEMKALLPKSMFGEGWWLERGIGRKRPPRDARPPRPGERVEYRPPMRREESPGLWRSRERPPHLCEYLASELADSRVMFAYLPWTREYGFRLVDLSRVIDFQPFVLHPVAYCPWCGERLPKPLRAEWLERLAAAGLEPSDFPLEVEAFPEGLGGDSWWRAKLVSA